MKLDLCLRCMTPMGENGVCPNCGCRNEDLASLPHQLPAGTILNGRYLVGRVLGEGGFGITYIGFDLALELKVAVKEYYPAGFVSRDVSATHFVSSVSVSGAPNMFENGKVKCMTEAKTMAKLDELREVVRVRDYFLSNNTAYIIMDFVEGVTLKDYVTAHGGRLSMTDALGLLHPVMTALGKVHQAGLIHRDISPDNIMVQSSGEARILDFGAAKSFELGGGATTTMTLKRGFSPVEQYSQSGEQGPWTDVYAMSATLYYCVTGQLPFESIDRISVDPVVTPSAAGADITPKQEKALMRGMAVQPDKRIRSMDELIAALEAETPSPIPVPVPPKPAPNISGKLALLKPKSKKLWIAVGGAAAVLVVVLILALGGNKGGAGVPAAVPAATSVSGTVSDGGVTLGNSCGNIVDGSLFCQKGKNLWFGTGLDDLYVMDTHYSTYVEDAETIREFCGCLNVADDSLYFIDKSDNDIITCGYLGEGQKVLYDGNDLRSLMYLRSGGDEILYFLESPDDSGDRYICAMSADGGDVYQLTDKPVFNMAVCEECIFFEYKDDDSVYRMELDGTGEKQIWADGGAMCCIADGGTLYIAAYSSGGNYVATCDYSGGDQGVIEADVDVSKGFNVSNGSVYYVSEEDSYLHVTDPSGSDKVLIEESPIYVSVSGSYVYFQNKDSSDKWQAWAITYNGDVISLNMD